MNQKGLFGLHALIGTFIVVVALSTVYAISKTDSETLQQTKVQNTITPTVEPTKVQNETDIDTGVKFTPDNVELPTPEITQATVVNTANLSLGGEWEIELDYPAGWMISNSVKSVVNNNESTQLTLVHIDPETNDFEDYQKGAIYLEILNDNDERLLEEYYLANDNAQSYPTSIASFDYYCYEITSSKLIDCVIKRSSEKPFLITLTELTYSQEFNILLESLHIK